MEAAEAASAKEAPKPSPILAAMNVLSLARPLTQQAQASKASMEAISYARSLENARSASCTGAISERGWLRLLVW